MHVVFRPATRYLLYPSIHILVDWMDRERAATNNHPNEKKQMM